MNQFPLERNKQRKKNRGHRVLLGTLYDTAVSGISNGQIFSDTSTTHLFLSIVISSVYGGPRTLMSLAETGYAASIFAYVDKSTNQAVRSGRSSLSSFLDL